MPNPHPRAGRSDGCTEPRPAHDPQGVLDLERAPVVFAWLLYRQLAFAGQIHLQTLYRLERVGTRCAEKTAQGLLQPSPYYGQSVEMLCAILRTQQHAHLPAPPPGCHWRGPEWVAAHGPLATPEPPPAIGVRALSAELRQRLDGARALASRLLRDRECA